MMVVRIGPWEKVVVATAARNTTGEIGTSVLQRQWPSSHNMRRRSTLRTWTARSREQAMS
jgi:hypothetical protein